MSNYSEKNKRIAKNALLLYFRMMLTMGVSLYTSRVVLRTLGVEDFGIYNVVGGVVAMFVFLNTAMSSTTQRFITFNLGKGDITFFKKIFFSCIATHFCIAIVVLILAETVGLWFLFNKLVIPSSRMNVAFWVFQCSIASAMISIVSVPYNADIIAHEKMDVFAYISILEVVLKLLVVGALYFIPVDKLLLYAILLMGVQIFIRLVYGSYCKKNFIEASLSFSYDKKIFKEIFSFTCWNLWGGMSNILYTQGLNLLLNIFFGPVVNAARGVSVQIQNAASQFSNSFQMAINPQITKTYANNDLEQMHKLIYRSSRFTFLVLLTLSIPFFVEAEYILSIWLGEYPEWSPVFVRLMLCIVIVDSSANPLMIAAAATGKIRFYQFVVGGLMLFIVPSSYIVLKLGCPPETVFFVHLSFCLITFVVRLFIVRSMIGLKIFDYFKQCVMRCGIVMIPIISMIFVLEQIHLFVGKFFVIIGVMVVTIVSCYILGLTSNERSFLNDKVMSYIRKFS